MWGGRIQPVLCGDKDGLELTEVMFAPPCESAKCRVFILLNVYLAKHLAKMLAKCLFC